MVVIHLLQDAVWQWPAPGASEGGEGSEHEGLVSYTSTNIYVKRFLVPRYFTVASTDVPRSSNWNSTNSAKEENEHLWGLETIATPWCEVQCVPPQFSFYVKLCCAAEWFLPFKQSLWAWGSDKMLVVVSSVLENRRNILNYVSLGLARTLKQQSWMSSL